MLLALSLVVAAAVVFIAGMALILLAGSGDRGPRG